MTGACIINSVDIATLGALIVRGGDHNLITFPTRKEPVMIEWPDADGFEIADEDPVFDAKKVTVQYYLKGNKTSFLNRLTDFANLHFVARNFDVYVREFDKTFSLRFAGITGMNISRGFSTTGDKNARITVEYVMDDPLQFINPAITTPTALRDTDTGVMIAGVDLADFGIIVKEVYSTAFKLGGKPGIVYSSRYANGNDVVHPSLLKKEKQNITIACAMICDDGAAFMSNWNALFNALAAPSVPIVLTEAGKAFTAYYSSMSDFKKRPWTRRAFAEFELNLVGYTV
jgi:hypothetical protein